MRPNITLPDLSRELTSTPETNSVHDYLERGTGKVLSNSITLNANNTSANVNVFQLTGSVEIMRIYGALTDTTTLTNCTGAYFDLYDSTAAVAITKNDGVLSGMAVGTFFLKNANTATTMAVADNSAGAVTEPATLGKAFYPFIVTQKTGANTYIRFNYTTTDAPANATATIYVEYREPPDSGGTLTAV